MKKLFKKTILILFLCSLFFSVFAISKVYAMGTTELPTSETTDYYETKIKPYLTIAIASAGGSLSGLISLFGISWKNFKNNKKQREEQTKFIENLCDKLGLSKEQTNVMKGTYETILTKVDELIEREVKPLLDKVEQLNDNCMKIIENEQALKKFITDTIQKTNINDERIIKILQIAFTNNKDLVQGGYATEIKKV